MLRRLRNRLRFRIERMLLRGAAYRLLFIAGLIALVSGVAGFLLMEIEQDFTRPGEAVWWAFLRLTDPGYLGDDEGLAKRAVSTALTTLGLMIFVGMLVAVLTQWLTQTVRNLERGLTPIVQSGHILLLGWTNRTPSIAQELVLSEERARLFLRRHGKRRLRLVILAEDVSPSMVQELKDVLGPEWDPQQAIFRTGSPLHIDHLQRVDFTHAAAIILPGEDFAPGGADLVDARTCKTLLSISRHGRSESPDSPSSGSLPLLVTEVFDARNLHTARIGYDGPVEVIASDILISRLIAQVVRHPGMSHIFNELLGSLEEGNEVYVRQHPELAGLPFEALGACFTGAIPLGAVRPSGASFSPVLNPHAGYRLGEKDRLVLLAEEYGATEARDPAEPASPARDSGAEYGGDVPGRRRLLVLGWNHKSPALLEELDSYTDETFEVTVLSRVPVADRAEDLERYGVELQRVEVTQVRADYTAPSLLQRTRPQDYDSVIVVASEFADSVEDADARTILACLLLRDLKTRDPVGFPHVLVELMDPENAHLLPPNLAEALVSPSILSHILAQVALRRELRTVFDELFGSGGAEIFFRLASQYDLTGQDVSFGELHEMALSRGEIAIGVRAAASPRRESGGVTLNPPRDSRWAFQEGDEVVVLTTYSERQA